MALPKFLMWPFFLIWLFLVHCQLHHVEGEPEPEAVPGLGINWGLLATHPINPPIVVNMLKDNGIKKAKIFDTDPWVVSAFTGSNIELMVGIPNDQLRKLARDANYAQDWVKNNVTKFVYNGGVNIRYVSVGNEPFLRSYNGSFVNITFPAMQNVQNAIDKAGYGDKIKVTTALNADVYESKTDKPSDGEFRPDVYHAIKEIVQFLDEHNSPFLVNIYPFLSLYQNEGFPIDLAFFDGVANPVTDNDKEYHNVFDANFDTLVWSLRKIDHSNVNIVIGEIGWPTDGNKHGTPSNAKRFYQGFLKKMASKTGTPLRPGPMDAYLFSLLDEDDKSIAPGNFERHWGIFRYDGKPKFEVDFSGNGENKMPVEAKGVVYQERKWCVIKPFDKSLNMSSLPGALSYACALGDCTSLGAGSSCANQSEDGSASYAFNSYFQISDQSVEACDFKGLANIVTDDPTNGTCFFPIQIESSGNMLTTLLIKLKAKKAEGISGGSELIELKNRLEKEMKREESYSREKSRCKWLKEGNSNTKFFHQMFQSRNQKNKIWGLVGEDREVVSDPTSIARVAEFYFQKIFTTTNQTDPKILFEDFKPTITTNMNVGY
ncbi:glucan endo-1,3-beta-glucosidase 8-like [Arachis stenosperma]|uniref:glucan endo-1,3-beta-glucosidase 8-like n=1 Tax=Arachis stenosperma TaxID=217475 RepID=UPI0025AD7E1B|nr:glucan endo-1,3-beta-glucosidase 8-like [Arachis stenosperma]